MLFQDLAVYFFSEGNKLKLLFRYLLRSLSHLNFASSIYCLCVVLSLETFLEKKWRIGYPSSSPSCPLSPSRCYFSSTFLLLRCQVPSSLLLLISHFLLYPSIGFHKDRIFFCSSTGFCNEMKRVFCFSVHHCVL